MTRGSWQRCEGGAWLYRGPSFSDERGESWEAYDLAGGDPPFRFQAVQENVVRTAKMGCARGLHYQVDEAAQAKLVSVVRGSAQFFWLPLSPCEERPTVHCAILPGDGASLYTPADCAHGFLALEDDTVFVLRLSRPVDHAYRGEINILSPRLILAPAVAIRSDLLSLRDRQAPDWPLRSR